MALGQSPAADFIRFRPWRRASRRGSGPSSRLPFRRRARRAARRPNHRPSRRLHAPRPTRPHDERQLAVSSPLPSRRTPSLPPRARPAAFSAAWSIVPSAFSLPESTAFWIAPVHLGIVLGEDVVEAALRQTHVERHLTALEASRSTRPHGSSDLDAATTGLAPARTDTATDADLDCGHPGCRKVRSAS